MSRPLRILIHGINYAPGATGLPKYNAGMGSWLAARGHRVEAIAGFPHYPHWRIAKEYRGRGHHTENIDNVFVHRIPVFLPPNPPIGTRERILLESSFTWHGMRS